jgi:engulfment/cell motility protein 1
MDGSDVAELVARLGADEESVRKMAVFKLQNAIGDPSFADVFISDGGLPKLRYLALHSTGNTLAYCLTSLARLLELDKGWDHVTDELIARVSARM